MAFEDAFLDDLRARLKVSEVIGSAVPLKKAGAEYRGIKDNSLTVNDAKRMWWDHSKQEGGDVFAWLVEKNGLTFPQAVEEAARLAGVTLPKDADGARQPRRVDNRPEQGPPPDQEGDPGAMPGGDAGNARERRPKRDIAKTYDYTDAQGNLIYQVCRIEWVDDGKPKKTFLQRRPTPEGDGHWIWGLGAGEFVQSRNGDWYQVNEDREKWDGKRRTIAEPVRHGLYNLVEFVELRNPEEPAFILEGEKDVETARHWQLVATTNSGGAGHWREEFADLFIGLDVVIPIDNDDAGRTRGETIAKTLRGKARSIKILDWAAVWPDAPKGADLTDWRTYEEGTRDQLLEIVARLPVWRPKPFVSHFGLMMYGEHNAPGDDYEYLVEDLIPKGEAVLIQGESQSGKSFFTQGLGLSGAEGREYFGHRVIAPFGVVYCAYEAGKGFKYRLRAHEQFFGLKEPIPFAVLTKPIDLWSNEINTDKLIEEIIGIAETRFGSVPLGAVVIDTHNRATPGASEIDSKDVSKIIDRYSRIMEKTRAGVWIIGHKNAAGKHRGNEQLYNNIETAIDISRKTEEVDKERIPVRDLKGHEIRVAKILKQREGQDGRKFEFVLPPVEVGTNAYGKPRTSCVAVPPATGTDDEPVAAASGKKILALNAETTTILRALKTAIEEQGEAPPASLGLPKSIKRAVKVKVWKDFYMKVAPDAADVKDNTINARMKRASEKLQNERVIGRTNPFVWLTGRPVRGVIAPKADDSYASRPDMPLPADIADFQP